MNGIKRVAEEGRSISDMSKSPMQGSLRHPTVNLPKLPITHFRILRQLGCG